MTTKPITLAVISETLAKWDTKYPPDSNQEYAYWVAHNWDEHGVFIEAVRALLPVVEAAVALHEFNDRISAWGMTPAQEMEKVHLFEDYTEALEALLKGE